jgi:ABC-type transport system involved in cytochrome c biogenesis ATPase subunit
MPLSGGTAAHVYMRQLGDAPLRAWLTDATFSALATADARQFAEIAEAVIAKGG